MGSRRPNGLCTTSAAQSPNLETASRLFLAGALNRALYDIAVRVACFDRAPNGVVLEMQRLMSGDGLSRPRDALERSGLGDDAVAAHRGHASRDRATAREVGDPAARIGRGGHHRADDRVLARGGALLAFD